MTRRAARRCLLLAMAGLAACGGASADEADRDPSPTSTTAPATTTTTVPPPYSFDGSVPPPELINTGTDYEAIYRSLSGYATWLLAHNPDEALLKNAYVVGTPVYNRFLSDVQQAIRQDVRLIDVNDRIDVLVVSESPSAVSLRVVETLDKVQAVGRNGEVADEGDYPEALTWLSLLQADAEGVWRIASVELAAA